MFVPHNGTQLLVHFTIKAVVQRYKVADRVSVVNYADRYRTCLLSIVQSTQPIVYIGEDARDHRKNGN